MTRRYQASSESGGGGGSARFRDRAVHELRGMINALALAVEVLDDPAANSDDVTAALTVIRNGVVELTLAVERLAAKPSKNSTFETPHS